MKIGGCTSDHNRLQGYRIRIDSTGRCNTGQDLCKSRLKLFHVVSFKWQYLQVGIPLVQWSTDGTRYFKSVLRGRSEATVGMGADQLQSPERVGMPKAGATSGTTIYASKVLQECIHRRVELQSCQKRRGRLPEYGCRSPGNRT